MWSVKGAVDFHATCPLYCSSSCIPWVLAGLPLNFRLFVLFALLMLWHIHFRPLLLHPSSGADPSPVALSAPRPQGLERRARLAGYCEFARFHRGHRQVDCGFSGAYRCPDLLLSDYVFCPGEYPLASDSPDEVVYLAKVCDAKNLLGIFDGHVDHYSEVRVFNNFTNEREGRQIGGQRGRNIQECKISGPSSFLPCWK